MSRTQTAMPAAEAADRSVADSSAVAAELGADLEKGLTAQTAARRLVEGGANELRVAAAIGALCEALYPCPEKVPAQEHDQGLELVVT